MTDPAESLLATTLLYVSKKQRNPRGLQRLAFIPFGIAYGWLIGGLLQGETFVSAVVGAAVPTVVAALLAAGLWWTSTSRHSRSSTGVDEPRA